MKELDDELNKISRKMEKAQAQLNQIAVKVDEVILDFDLCDFSNDTLRVWYEDFCRIADKVDSSIKDFDDFAFDGDSIKEISEDEVC